MRTICASRVSLPDSFGAHEERACAVDRAAGNFAVDDFLDWNRLAGHHRFIDRALPFGDHTVDRNFLTGANSQEIAAFNLIQRNVPLAAISSDQARGFRGEAEQRANRAAGLTARAQFEHLAEQHKRCNDGCRFEIDTDFTAMTAERIGEPFRHQGRNQAVPISRAHPHADQREHVRTAIDQ